MNNKIHRVISVLITSLSSELAGSKQVVRKDLFYALYNQIASSSEFLFDKEFQE